MTASSTVMLIFAGALVLAIGGTPLARRAALRLGLVDRPSDRKVHTVPMPRMGGVAIVVASLAMVVVFRGRIEFEQLGGILLGAALVSILGAVDDRWDLAPIIKLLGQLLATAILIATDVMVRLAGEAHVLNVLLTALWVIAITNGFNLLDNMDGLSSGLAAVAAAYFTLLAAMSGQSHVGALSAAVLGATLGFLIYNFSPASVFMGDSGSLFLGFVMAAIGIKLQFPDNVPFVTWMAPVLVLGVPLFDTALVVASRLRRRLNPFTTPGKDHASHRLVAIGFTTKEAVMTHYLAACALGSLAVFITQSNAAEGYIAGGIAVLVGLIGIVYLEWRFARTPCSEADT
jgi:UDP-GlcNAc:undecaprenyl-phosphate GlcNAc-1-phosphate transferase